MSCGPCCIFLESGGWNSAPADALPRLAAQKPRQGLTSRLLPGPALFAARLAGRRAPEPRGAEPPAAHGPRRVGPNGHEVHRAAARGPDCQEWAEVRGALGEPAGLAGRAPHRCRRRGRAARAAHRSSRRGRASCRRCRRRGCASRAARCRRALFRGLAGQWARRPYPQTGRPRIRRGRAARNLAGTGRPVQDRLGRLNPLAPAPA